MNALDRIAKALGRNDEESNIELAEQLAATEDTQGIAEIAAGLAMDRTTASDCLKVLYEISYRKPALVVPYTETFLQLLRSGNNRFVWGAMIALGHVAELNPEPVFAQLDTVLAAYGSGGVITVDNTVNVLAGLCKAEPAYEKRIMPLLIRHFQKCRSKEIPQHLERAAACYSLRSFQSVADVVQNRFQEMSASQQARVRKALKKLRT